MVAQLFLRLQSSKDQGSLQRIKRRKVFLKCRQRRRDLQFSVRRRARSGPPRFDEASSSSPKRSSEGGGSLETNRDISRGKSYSRKSDFSNGLETSKVSTGETEGEEGILQCKLINEVRNPISAVSERDLPLSGAFEPNLFPKPRSLWFILFVYIFFFVSVGVKPRFSAWVEGLTPREMVKVQSVLESLRVRIVRDNGKGVEGENRNPLSADKVLGEKEDGEKVFKYSKPRCGDASRNKREIWDRRLVSSIWKVKFNCSEKVLGSFSVTVKLNSDEEESFWLTSVYGPNKAVWREDFWLELQDLHGLTFPRWCVGGDFNVIRRISEKRGDSRLTVNMRRFDEFIRESEALPRWTSDHSPICLETNPFMWGPTPFRFENMWLFHPEFKEKFRDWWQECTVEGWEGRIDRIEQEGNLNLELVSERILRRKELEDLLLKEEPFSEEEVRMAVFQLNKEKAPGPDGFTLAVYQECWDVIKEDLMRVFFEFHTKGVLSGRLRKVLHETIFGSQGAFVEGRQILDAVLIANEVVDEKRRSGEEGVVFKIDFEKAYDHVEWGFLDHVLQRKGFSQKWRSWMRGCLSSSSFAILVNGNAKGWVKASRGLRQGDPLSPFLFTLVADVLSRLMIRAEETGITEGFLVGRDRTRVSLLQFADDTIFFSKASLDLLQNLKIILLVFGQVSGLKINLEKSTISGLPLGGNPKTIGFWDPVLLPSLFKIPVSIASKIEKMQRDFLWSGAGEGKRDHLIRWEVVSRPREMGGLGFGKTSMRNSALLGKWLWRFPRERSGLWHKVIASIYGTHPNGWDANMVVRWSHRCPWKAIAQVFQEFSPFVRLVVGNGERIRFWEDLWWGNQTLCAQFADSTELFL
ncbi:LINE-1 retrotransposable element ORF2 protein [Vitis vinifera]|uniref:LINE-1 retrotransposable element ORF2 protein n=1 Tax=Vitis vinifera TaxID=29760 RepID=A0A438HQF7_VITVI|nr:LINE-1 retrotransposable element ORF2 protein [Vitis vinifera]